MGVGVKKVPRILTCNERKWAGIPRGGHWVNLKSRAKTDADAMYGKNKGFILAWGLPAYLDRKGNLVEGATWFGSYVDAKTCLAAMMELAVDCRFGFEMVREGLACNLYLDIEWMGCEEDEETTILRILAALRAYIRKTYGREFALQITRGSRRKGGGFKCSFHVIVTGLVFEDNQQTMKACAESIQATLSEEDQHIDLGVYTKDRVMRTVMSCKRSSNIAMRNVTGDAWSSTKTVL